MRKSRIISAALALVTAAAAFSGCADKGYDKLLNKNDPVTVTVWHYYNGVQQTQFDEMVVEFNNTVGSEKGIYVEAFSKNSVSELAASVTASVNGEPGVDPAPDIFAAYLETAYQLGKSDVLCDFNKYFTEEEKAQYVEEYIAEGNFGEKSFCIFPTAKSTEVMMINTTDWQPFAAAEGVSFDDLATWEGLAAAAEKYYAYTDALTPDVPNDGKALFGRDAVANYMMIGAKQLGSPFNEVVAAKGFDDSAKAAVRRLWDCFYVPFVKGCYAAESRFRSDDAKIGKILAMVCSTTGAAYFPREVTMGDDKSYPIENTVLPVPNFEGTDPYIVQQGAGMCLLKSDEKSEYAACVFLKWFTEEERNIAFSVNSGYLPVKKDANDIAKITSGDISPVMQATLKTAISEINDYALYTSPAFDNSAEVRDYIGSFMESSAKDDCKAAWDRISAGENRDTVLAEYTSDAAFDKWFAAFEKGVLEAAGV